MTDTEILEDIKRIIEKEFGVEKDMIEEDSNLDEDLNITDLEIEDLVTKLQEHYDVQIPQSTIENFRKVSDIVTFVYESLNTSR